MDTNKIIAELNVEIARLTHIRSLLVGQTEGTRRGRPKGTQKIKTEVVVAKSSPKRRTLSPEAKARIAAAQKARWAKQKKAAS